MKFSVIIPTWNNLAYLKLCIKGLRLHSAIRHQILVHVNEGSDGSAAYLQGLIDAGDTDLAYTTSAENIGICKAVNRVSQLATTDYIVFMNDDMYALPGWDTALAGQIRQLTTDCFQLSSTMIEPYDTGNKCVLVGDYGRGEDNFDEQRLVKEYSGLLKKDWSGATWPPSVVHRKWWQAVGGYSEEFSPGMSSDDDFAMKLWQAGCRIYQGVGASKVYHFISKSTGRIVKNDGRKQFMRKWGLKQSAFHKYYTHRGQPYTGTLREPGLSPGLWLSKLSARLGI